MAKVKRKRLVIGRDFDAWAFKAPMTNTPNALEKDWAFWHYATHKSQTREKSPTDDGKWVRVKFVEVK